jgi:hypothetical protein
MTEKLRNDALRGALRAYGSDFSRWPADLARSAPATSLSTPEFRRAWEEERSFDHALADERGALDATIIHSGALERVRSRTLAHLPVPLAGLPWQRIAAAMLVAGMLGGATDLLISSSLSEPSEPALIDPLLGLDIPEAR